jgi:cobalt-zinc-cadmium resistance protein CzcA
LITAALRTVYKAMLEGIVFVVVILFLFLGNVRSALIVTATLILSPLATFIIMGQSGLSANLMSLGGLAIAIGMIVDGSVVVVENVYRHLSEQRDHGHDKVAMVCCAPWSCIGAAKRTRFCFGGPGEDTSPRCVGRSVTGG